MTTRAAGLDPFLDRIERAMDVMSRRQQLVAANISNIDTPGYRTEDVDFKAALHRAMNTQGTGIGLHVTQPGHISAAQGGRNPGDARHVAGLALRNDGNDVNLDREMLNMSMTRSRYDASANIARMRVRQLVSAIEDGRG